MHTGAHEGHVFSRLSVYRLHERYLSQNGDRVRLRRWHRNGLPFVGGASELRRRRARYCSVTTSAAAPATTVIEFDPLTGVNLTL